MRDLREKVVTTIAWHLPRAVAYWCAIRLGAHATTGKWGGETPDSVSLMTALQRWGEANNTEPGPADTAPPLTHQEPARPSL